MHDWRGTPGGENWGGSGRVRKGQEENGRKEGTEGGNRLVSPNCQLTVLKARGVLVVLFYSPWSLNPDGDLSRRWSRRKRLCEGMAKAPG